MPRIFVLLLILTIILLSLIRMETPAPAKSCGGYSYTPQCYAPVKEYLAEPPEVNLVQPVIVQENLAPAFVFQALQAYTPVTTVITPPNQPSQPQPQTNQPYPPQAQTQTSVSQNPGVPNEALIAAIADRVVARLNGTQDDSQLPSLNTGNHEQGTLPQVSNAQLDNRAINYFQTACSKCHSASSPKGNVVLFNSQGEFQPSRTDGQALTRNRIREVLESGEMPKGAQANPALRAPQDIIQLVREWETPHPVSFTENESQSFPQRKESLVFKAGHSLLVRKEG